MIRIAICDDEKNMSDNIRAMVSAFFRRENMETVTLQFSCGKELLDCDKNLWSACLLPYGITAKPIC